MGVGEHKLLFEFTTGKIETSLTIVKKDDVPSDNNNNTRPDHKPDNSTDNKNDNKTNKIKNKLVKTGISNNSIIILVLSAILLGILTLHKRVIK